MMYRRTQMWAALLGLLFLVTGCGRVPFWSDDVFSFRLEAVDGSMVDLGALRNNTASVFVFLAPDCPLSQNYTLTLNELSDQFVDQSVLFYGVIAGNWFETAEIEEFINTYQTRFPLLLDRDFLLTEHFEARVTPEVFVVDKDGATLYRGAIDNWSGELGQHRTVVTAHYLRDALTRIARGRLPEIIATQATGCYIERIG